MTSALGPPDIDAEQVEVSQRVALAHPELSIGFVLEERNGCVHFEIVRAPPGRDGEGSLALLQTALSRESDP